MSDLLLPLALLGTFTAILLGAMAVDLSLAGRRRAVRVLEQQVHRPVGLREADMERSLRSRVLAPALGALGGLGMRLTPVGFRNRLARKLILAGSPFGWDAEKVAAVKLAGLGAGATAGFLIGTAWSLSGLRLIGLVVLLALLGFLVPDGVLDSKVRSRREAIRRALPDTMDLLTITVEAGLGFDAALAQVMHNTTGPLAQEIGRMLQEVQLGVPRADALRHLGDRTDLEEINSFVLAMVQAEVFGVSISKVLRGQAGQLRIKRRQRAELRSMQVPVKILFPLIFCIMPALFVVILGPGVIKLSQSFFGLG